MLFLGSKTALLGGVSIENPRAGRGGLSNDSPCLLNSQDGTQFESIMASSRVLPVYPSLTYFSGNILISYSFIPLRGTEDYCCSEREKYFKWYLAEAHSSKLDPTVLTVRYAPQMCS